MLIWIHACLMDVCGGQRSSIQCSPPLRLSFWFLTFIYLFFIWYVQEFCVHVCKCTTICIQCLWRPEEWLSPLQLEQRMVVSHQVSVGNKTRDFCKRHWTTFLWEWERAEGSKLWTIFAVPWLIFSITESLDEPGHTDVATLRADKEAIVSLCHISQ